MSPEQEIVVLRAKLAETEDALLLVSELHDQAQQTAHKYVGVVECILAAARANRYVPASLPRLIRSLLKEAGLRP
jgi:hypothetical protein